MLSAQPMPLETTEETMPQPDEPLDKRDVDAIDKRQHLRIATKVGTEFMERAQTFLGLGDEVRIILKREEARRIL